jgi:phage gp29-like protein
MADTQQQPEGVQIDGVSLVPTPSPPAPDAANRLFQSVYDRFRDYPSRNPTPKRLEYILQTADGGYPEQWIEFCEEMLEKDSKLGSVFQTRTSALTGLDWDVTPADDSPAAKEVADFCDWALQQFAFKSLCTDLLDSVGKGFAVSWLFWGVRDAKNVVTATRRISQRLFIWDGERDELKMRMDPNGGVWESIEPWTTVRCFYGARADHPTRFGILRPLSWLYIFKNYSIKDWVIYNERYGMPSRIAKVPRNDLDNAELMTRLRQNLRSIGIDASGIFPDDASLEIIYPPGQQTPVYQNLVDTIDKWYGQAVLGHELAAQSSPGAGQLGVTAALMVRQDILEFDAELLNDVLRRDLLTPLTGFNFGWERRNLAPNVYFKAERPIDKGREAAVISTLSAAFPKMPFSMKQIREQFDVLEPSDPADEVFGRSGGGGSGGGIFGPGGGTRGDQGIDVPAAETQPAAAPLMSDDAIAELAAAVPEAPPAGGGTPLDQIVDQGKAASRTRLLALRAPIERIVREAIKNGWSAGVVAHEMAQAYPELDTSKIEQAVFEALVLARLYGRAAARAKVTQ